MITKRQQQILNLIISLYTQNHKAVGSKALMTSINASSATIRNDMKALETLGFIQKEHTSSGRVPSVTGYKYFVENFLKPGKLDNNDVYQVMKRFDGEFYKLDVLYQQAAQILSDMTGFSAFILNVSLKNQVLSKFDIVQLDSHSAMAVMTLDTGLVKTMQFSLPRSMTLDDLTTFKFISDERLVGKRILDIHYSLLTEIPQVAQKYFVVTTDVLQLFDHVFSDLFKENLISAGRQNLLEYSDDIVSLYKILMDDDAIIHEIRDMVSDDEIRSVKFDSSLTENHQISKNITLMTQQFVVPYRGLGTLALMGPVDLDYQKVVSTMDLVAKILTMKLSDYYRYLDGNHYEVI
ncbi:heat-inducible transcriptional repressor HrcA [Pseudolactococcus reticulitermitis]|uniref:Heat-inducible transcription repressor HrcA n=1 Tax=Pseudolactococcus reticulitermitis TaxID=2025039 RepID=A0A224XAF3_9LACT|nr:heat-inducible transcriptional repressor HrcA [Lactococcus reticulitermitis]GAX46695.1 heat-inducible transcription repressor HrcA [Lactococcus reticulitermitis]